jgi:iron complex outermembrane receptor protein
LIQQANSNIPGTGVVPLIPNYDMFNVGFFAIEKFTSGPLEIEGGFRYDFRHVESARVNRGGVLQEDVFDFNNFSAFIGGIYPISRNLTFNTNFGTAWRPPSINEQFSQGLHHGLAAIEIGNPDFVSEQSFKWMNTLNYSGSKVNVELTGYTNTIQNYIYLNPTEDRFVSLRGTFNVFEYLQTDAFFMGTDLSAIWTVSSHWELFSRGSIVRATNTTEDTFLPFIPADRLETGLSYSFETGVSKNNSKISFSNLAVAKQNREPDFDLAPAPPAYLLWNLGIQTGFKLGQNKLNFGFQATNLFDKAYKDYMNRFRYFSHELGRNVLIKLNYEF